MAKQAIHKGTTSKMVALMIRDLTQNNGSGLTGLTSGSGGLSAYYWRDGDATATAISLTAGTIGTWGAGGQFVEVDAVNLPGIYQLSLPDAVLASGHNWSIVMLKGATNMVVDPLEIQLTDVDLNNGTSFGMTNLDATVSSRLAAASITLAAGAVTVGTNNDKTAYTLTAGEEAAIADVLLKRDWTGLTGEASHSVLNALRFVRNRWTLIAGTLTVYKEDAATTAYSKTATTTPGTSPVTGTSD